MDGRTCVVYRWESLVDSYASSTVTPEGSMRGGGFARRIDMRAPDKRSANGANPCRLNDLRIPSQVPLWSLPRAMYRVPPTKSYCRLARRVGLHGCNARAGVEVPL